jgi:transcriptional antiterminator RfaH
LRGLSGLFDGTSDEERVIILLDLLGRQVRVQVPLETVQAVA